MAFGAWFHSSGGVACPCLRRQVPGHLSLSLSPPRLEEMVLIPACESCPLHSGHILALCGGEPAPPVHPSRAPGLPSPRVAPLCSVSWIMGGILRRPVMGLGPGKGPQQLHTEASVQQPTPRGSPPTFPGCRHLQGTAPGRLGGRQPVSRQ